MPPRLPAQGFSSFIAFYSCSRQVSGSQLRNYSIYRTKCLRRPPSTKRAVETRHIHATAPCRAGPRDPYQVLGVKPDATPAEIKKTYFALARKYHPDTNPDKGARDKFVEIQEAYDILKDEKKRAAFDQYGHSSQSPGFDPNAFAGSGAFGGGFGRAGGFSGFSQGPSGDLFDQLFGSFAGGGRGRTPQNTRGDNIQATIAVNFLEACRGAKKKLTITPIVDCTTCSGSGLKSGVERSTCSTCHGTGTQTFVIQNGFQMASTCSSCSGQGSTVPRGGECTSCDGVGKVRTKQTITVTIPAGAEEGMTLRIPNVGDVPLLNKGLKGDLFVRLNVTPSLVFTRQGANLYYQARIPFHRALLGGIVRVPTLDGEVDVRVPGGTQQGEEMVLKGRGVSYLNGIGAGDLFVKFSLQLPRSLTPKQRSLLEAYAADVEKRTYPAQSTSKDAKEPLTVDNDTSGSSDSPPPSEQDPKTKRATG